MNLHEIKGQSETGFIVATVPLTSEPWQDLPPGRLVVFHEGQQIFPVVQPDTDKEETLHALYLIRTSSQRESVFYIMNMIGLELEQANIILQPLLNKGYIRQDRRDRGSPFEHFSTYYTVPAKRNEIDQLLKEDAAKVVISAEQIDFSVAEEEDKLLACVSCQTFYKEGITFCRKCLERVNELDTRIADIIFSLNAKGYKTEHSCAGRGDYIGKPYIAFSFNIDVSGPTCPQNYAWEHSKKVLRMMSYHKVMGITKKKMEQTITKETLEKFAINNLETLRSWADSLPVIDGN